MKHLIIDAKFRLVNWEKDIHLSIPIPEWIDVKRFSKKWQIGGDDK